MNRKTVFIVVVVMFVAAIAGYETIRRMHMSDSKKTHVTDIDGKVITIPEYLNNPEDYGMNPEDSVQIDYCDE